MTVLALLGAFGASALQAQTSLRFFGNGSRAPDLDRVKISIDAPSRPADIGDTDFTIELWLRGSLADNTGTVTQCGNTYDGWIRGNIFYDRDRYSSAPGHGLSLGNGRVAFAVVNAARLTFTICGTTNVLDGQWHHIAVTRTLSGQMRLYIDGVLDASGTGPSGDISYPDNATPRNDCAPVGGSTSCSRSDPFLVLGAEKHDAGTLYPAFNGFMDELRLSSTVRYTANFNRPSQPFAVDGFTRALYRFDEGAGTTLSDAVPNGSPGVLRIGGTPAGPVWSTQTPFSGPTTTLGFQSDVATFGENTGTANFTVSRTGTGTGAASVNWNTSAGTATAGSDFTASNGTITWTAGDTTPKVFSVPVADDAEFESNETFTVTLSNPVGGSLGPIATVTATILDNDPPPSNGVLQWTQSSPVVSESSGTVNFPVSRTGPSTGAVGASVVVVPGASAQVGSDFVLQTSTLTWAAGDSAPKQVSVQIVNDDVVEIGETFRLQLTNPTGGATLGSATNLIATIEDDDAGVGFPSGTSPRVFENQTPVSIQVARSGTLSGAVSVDFQTVAESASAGSDFVARSGTLSWAAGDSSLRIIDITIVDDAQLDDFETFSLRLTNPMGASIVGAAAVQISIDDDDVAVRVLSGVQGASEGAAGVSIDVERIGSTQRAFAVDYATADGTAVAGADYTATAGRLSFLSGTMRASIFVPLLEDALSEGDETFSVQLRDPSGAVLGNPSATQVTIADNDVAIEFVRPDYSVGEQAGSIALQVRRRGATQLATSATWRTSDGSATAPADYQAIANGAVAWAAGETVAKTINVPIVNDTLAEGVEGFSVVLLPSAGVLVGNPSVAVVTVFDDDGASQTPAATTVVSPQGLTSTATPLFTWNAVLGTAEYLLWVEDVGGRRILQWFTAAQAGCPTGTGSCTVAPGVVLAVGPGRWWVQTWNANGYGPWSAVGNFTVQLTPGASVPLGPTGSASPSPTLSWQAVAGAQEYLLWIDDEAGALRLRQWIGAAAAGCAGGTGVCSATPSIVLPTGRARFYVQTWNASGYGPWSSALTFFVGGAPAAATLIAPAGTIATSLPTYSWNAVPGSVEYLLWVDDSGAAPRIRQWITAAAAGCGGGTGVCSITPTTALAAGAGRWWVQGWNPVGYGPWSSASAFVR